MPRRIKRIIIISLIILAVMLPAAVLLFDGAYLTGVLAGGLIGSLNLYFLALMIVKIMADGAPKGTLVVRFLLKYVLIGLLMVGVVFVLGCHPLGIAVGFSNIFLAIMIDGLFIRDSSGDIEN